MPLLVAASVTRDRTDPPDVPLNLEDPGTYRIVTAGPGAVSWVRTEATSPYVHGATIVHARKELVVTPLAVRVYGATANQLHANIATLRAAFDQFRYQLTITIDGETYTWKCGPADYSPGRGDWDKFALMAHQQVYVFSIPRDPTPVAGAH